MNPVLSICLPSYKRKKIVVPLLLELLKQKQEIDDGFVEVIVSLNPSEDSALEEIEKIHNSTDFLLNINDHNIGGAANLKKTIQLASGKYVWIVGDDDFIVPGLVKDIVEAIMLHPDVTWIHMNSAEIGGDAEDDNAKLIEATALSIPFSGYQKNGKSILLKHGPKLDGKLLFSTANIYLKECSLAIINSEKNASNNSVCFQLTATIASAVKGAAFFINYLCIVQGGQATWGNSSYDIIVNSYNDAVYESIKYGLTKKEISNYVRKRITLYALYIWLALFKRFFKKPGQAIRDWIKYFKRLPFTTLLMTLFSPIWIVLIICRHFYRTQRRRKDIKALKKIDNLPECVKRRL